MNTHRFPPVDPNEYTPDQYLYGQRIMPTAEQIAEADRQWAAIPSDPAKLASWIKGDPINEGDEV